MFGIKSSGCFIIGIMTGFIIALFLGTACIFFFNPSIKQKTLDHVEQIWKKIKSNVDDSLDAAKNAPTLEPEIPAQKNNLSRQSTPAAPKQSSAPTTPAGQKSRIEIKLNI